MKEKIRNFWYDEEGMGTLEVLIIVVVLVGIALMFKGKITGYVRDIFTSVDAEKGNMTKIEK